MGFDLYLCVISGGRISPRAPKAIGDESEKYILTRKLLVVLTVETDLDGQGNIDQPQFQGLIEFQLSYLEDIIGRCNCKRALMLELESINNMKATIEGKV
jgi:hypothetical protein